MTATLDGLTYAASGSGTDTIVCLHGIGGSARSFHHQMGAFPNHRVIALNLPGYQGSDVRLSPPTFAHQSERLATAIDQIGGPVHLVGQSIGGMIALEHAVRRADQVKSLTLVATTPRFGARDDSFKTAFLKARLDPLDQGQSMAEMAALTAPHLVGSAASMAEIKHIETTLATVPEATWRDILHCLVSFDRADDLANLTCPSLIVAGDEDRNAPAKTMQKMAAAMPSAQFHLFNNAGHMLHQEMPDAFNALLSKFLTDIGPT